MSKVLVTGGAGFIGSNLVDLLLAQGYKVRVLDDLSSGKLHNLPSNNKALEFIQGSIEDKCLVAQACRNVTHVVHLAALVSVPVSIQQPARSAAINLLGFLNLLNQLRSQNFQGRFIYASSSAVYGGNQRDKALKEEDAPGQLLSPYAVDKYTNELYANLYASLFGISSLGLRFFNIYGPRQDPSSDYSGVISIFMDRASRGEKIGVYGDGEQVRDFVYVGDLVKVLCLGINSTFQGVLNVGAGTAVSINKLAEFVQDTYKISVSVDYLPAREGDIRYSCADVSALEKALGNKPTMPLNEGLEVLRDWMA